MAGQWVVDMEVGMEVGKLPWMPMVEAVARSRQPEEQQTL